MRKVTLAVCAAAACVLSVSASAEPIQPTRPLFVNDHDGGLIPNENGDSDFIINPDGENQATPASTLGVQPDQDQDEDGDIAMYQGQDDDVPC